MKANTRFLVIWAAILPFVLATVPLVPALGIAHWSTFQVSIVIAESNAGSALVLAVVAYFWAKSVKEPAAMQGAVTGFTVATIFLGNAFSWWSLADDVTQLVTVWIGLGLIVLLVLLNRSVAWSPESVAVAVAEARTPEAMLAAMHEKLHPPTGIATAAAAPAVVHEDLPVPSEQQPDADAAEQALLDAAASAVPAAEATTSP